MWAPPDAGDDETDWDFGDMLVGTSAGLEPSRVLFDKNEISVRPVVLQDLYSGVNVRLFSEGHCVTILR